MGFSFTTLFFLSHFCCAVLAMRCDVYQNQHKPRVFILSDISNEPDDTQSMIRLLVHSDRLQIEGLVATTSYWLNSSTHADEIEAVVAKYGEVLENLQVHGAGEFPSTSYLRSCIESGPSEYGLAALNNKMISAGAQLLIEAVDASSLPLYVQVWGGANCLAEALVRVRTQRSEVEVKTFISKLRVYSISDQDDSGVFIRREFPQVIYLVSVHGWNTYGLALWTGISGEKLAHFDEGGPDSSLVEDAWIRRNIQIGPLGGIYPDVMFIMEGDSPAILYSFDNGLNSPENPEWGGWGGRYESVDLTGASKHYADAVDKVVGINGKNYWSNHATIWRFREAFQNEFAARMQWTITGNYATAAHPPVAVVNGTCGTTPIHLTQKAGSTVYLDASESYDTDTGNLSSLRFRYWMYPEVTATQWNVHKEVPQLNFTTYGENESRVWFQLPAEQLACAALERGMLLRKSRAYVIRTMLLLKLPILDHLQSQGIEEW